MFFCFYWCSASRFWKMKSQRQGPLSVRPLGGLGVLDNGKVAEKYAKNGTLPARFLMLPAEIEDIPRHDRLFGGFVGRFLLVVYFSVGGSAKMLVAMQCESTPNCTNHLSETAFSAAPWLGPWGPAWPWHSLVAAITWMCMAPLR